jgi:Xaa-Pro aminopeptidase
MLARLGDIQLELRARELEGWLLTDFEGQNRVPRLLLELEADPTRRYYYWIPADGMPVVLCSRADAPLFADVQGEVWHYTGWSDYRDQLGRLFDAEAPIAMEHCPMGSNAFLDRVSAGALDLVRSYGAFVVSSADLVPTLLGRLDEERAASFDAAAATLDACVTQTFEWLAHTESPSERATQSYLAAQLTERGLVAAGPILVAFGSNTELEEPSALDAVLTDREVVRMEIAARPPERGACCVEVSRTGAMGAIPDLLHARLELLGEIHAKVVELVSTRLVAERRVLGFELDRLARDTLHRHRDLRDAFPHRLGHALGPVTPFGEAGLLDDLEMHETRPLLPGSAWCIKPGLYLDGMGVRSCASVRLTRGGVSFAASPQLEPTAIRKT